MANWDVFALASQLRVGASLCVIESPQLKPPSKPGVGEFFRIEYPIGSISIASVEEASDAELVIRIGVERWRLVPQNTDSDEPRVEAPRGVHSTYWVIQSKA